jgi:hypothetical protein
VKYKNSPKTKLTSPVKNITTHNAYGILSQSNDPIPDNKTIFVHRPPSQQDADVCKHCRQRKIARRQHIKLMLRLLSKKQEPIFGQQHHPSQGRLNSPQQGGPTNLQRFAIERKQQQACN